MMYSYISNYTKPNGHSPLIGDNDDGRFAPFLKRDFRDHNYLNNPLSVENIIVSAGAKPLFCSDINENRFYEDAGVGIIREKRDYLFVNNGGYSKKPKETDMVIGTHTHNDCLSFELSLNGDDVIVDPGTYLYTSSKVDRDAFRSTSKHNTIVVDDEEQNMMGAPFELKRNVRALYLRSFNERQIEGSYTTISEKLYHYRSFTFTDGVLIISDQLKKEGSGHTAKVYLHFAEGIIPKITQHTIALNHDVMISFSLIPDSIGVIDDFISPSFGVLVKSKTAVVTFRFDNELLFETKINRI